MFSFIKLNVYLWHIFTSYKYSNNYSQDSFYIMKIICSISVFLLVFIGSMAFTACNITLLTEPIVPAKNLPFLTTNDITQITQNTATTGGIITSEGGFEVAARGVCWSLNPNPKVTDSITMDAAGTGNFTSSIKNLIANTTYYVRAYATNKDGTAYGLQKTIKTLAIILPVLSTIEVSNITISTATSGGNVTFDGGSAITTCGVCWSIKSNPTITNNKTSDGNGIGSFTTNLSGLIGNTTYFVRAYATNSVGTSYGNQFSFVTPVTDIDGNVYKTVTIGTQTWMVEDLKTTKYKDGTAIPQVTDATAWVALTTPGYCWYNNDAATNKSTYGALYNWYTVNTAKLAPAGWHVASDDEWATLESYVSVNFGTSGSLVKALAATTNWASSTTTGTPGNNLTINNSSRFTALPGGYRSNDGSFNGIGRYGNWWSSAEGSTSLAWLRALGYSDVGMYGSNYSKCWGLAIRCVRDY